MRTRLLVLAALVCPTLAAAAPVPKEKPKDPPRSDRVDRLYAQMREGNYSGHRFPALGPDDIPALLQMADNTKTLKSFPVNPLSSYIPESTNEGVLALWLVEGIRQGGTYPTLFTPSEADLKDPKVQPALAKAYRAWWAQVKDKPDEMRKVDPLKDTKLNWNRLRDGR
jgi:hypothetical protein